MSRLLLPDGGEGNGGLVVIYNYQNKKNDGDCTYGVMVIGIEWL